MALACEVFVPGIRVRIEMEHANGPMPLRNGAQLSNGAAMIAAQADCDGTARNDTVEE